MIKKKITRLSKIQTKQDVINAIDLITRQGEGAEGSLIDTGPDDLAHYYRFLEIKKNRYIEEDGTGGYRYSDGKINNLDGGIGEPYPVAEVPAGGYNESNVPVSDQAQILPLMDEFNREYTKMLKLLEKAWGTGDPNYLIEAIMKMFSLTTADADDQVGGSASKIIKTPIEGTSQKEYYGPSFIVLPDLSFEEPDVNTQTPVWENDIKQLLQPYVNAMIPYNINLGKYENVKKNADRILYQVNAHKMPPNPYDPWDDTKINKFRRWMEIGMPETQDDLK
ncbi:ferritin-like domain-containing protein [Moorena sp. SIO2C4]|uniref:ferritin-like domain-containing protein n=1 Tax=Moorena sp. SIO2C4 TaxID=2607824 RepID=UPI0013CC4450|nr:ferritin-like domain-containing protein [Moorena sp. SIO2C4]NES43428.1 hypothetical protein [Moorena sp. SIO2C4]